MTKIKDLDDMMHFQIEMKRAKVQTTVCKWMKNLLMLMKKELKKVKE